MIDLRFIMRDGKKILQSRYSNTVLTYIEGCSVVKTEYSEWKDVPLFNEFEVEQ